MRKFFGIVQLMTKINAFWVWICKHFSTWSTVEKAVSFDWPSSHFNTILFSFDPASEYIISKDEISPSPLIPKIRFFSLKPKILKNPIFCIKGNMAETTFESNVILALTFGICSIWLKIYKSGISKSDTFLFWLSKRNLVSSPSKKNVLFVWLHCFDKRQMVCSHYEP